MWLISELGRRHTSELWSPHRDDTSSFYDAVTRDLWLGWATLQRRSCVRFAAAEKHTRLSSLSSLVNDWRVAALPATEQPQMVYVCRSKPQSDATCGGDPRLLATVARSCTWKGSSNETWEATSPFWRGDHTSLVCQAASGLINVTYKCYTKPVTTSNGVKKDWRPLLQMAECYVRGPTVI